MSNCKYKTPCGICRVKTDEDLNGVIHYCKYEGEEAKVQYPKADSHKAYWDNVGQTDMRGEEG